ncbi:hypothetical protein [Polaromonas sp.]|uniref:hypothetical protein n=1 Tax=Polaromonas sp. TaxID=1869339 RepID=UPI0013B6209C|nr:hypothetical protein [Polaromonas sp.]NDP62478.1 hypothetical protein [Polaromonas sp.]
MDSKFFSVALWLDARTSFNAAWKTKVVERILHNPGILQAAISLRPMRPTLP